jgi:hypothetical protein
VRRWVVLLAVLACGCGGAKHAAQPAPRPAATGDLGACQGLVQDAGRACYTREIRVVVDRARDPLAAVDRITAAAYADKSGFLLANCHGIMHTIGREWGVAHHLKLDQLIDHLPRSNDPGCAAGYAHGLVTAVAPQIGKDGARTAEEVCNQATTRYERYSCLHGFGHAFMRVSLDLLPAALHMCEQLGADAPDCAQGAYHDYWFSVSGYDSTHEQAKPVTDPRVLCRGQTAPFVRGCWYRAFLEAPGGRRVHTAQDVLHLCDGLTALQRGGCVTGAALVGPPDPRDQLTLCDQMPVEDQFDCIRATKVQNLINFPNALSVQLVRGCAQFTAYRMAGRCYRWLGRTIGVVTDGRFRRTGCAKLSAPARRACDAGVDGMGRGPLVTFS